MQVSKEEIRQHFAQILETEGDAAYEASRRAFVRMSVKGPNLDPKLVSYFMDTFPDLDVEEEVRKAAIERMQQYVPNLKTQAQYDLYAVAHEAFACVFNSYYGGMFEQGLQARAALNKALDALSDLISIERAVTEESPDPHTSSSKTVESPLEEIVLGSLLQELSTVTSNEDLIRWWQTRRGQIESLVAHKAQLSDAVLAKQRSFRAPECQP
jgi:hypothetical protein